MYYKVDARIVNEQISCPNCAQPVMVSRQPARIYAECSCGAKMEVTERRAVHVPMIKLDLPHLRGRG